MSAPIKSPAAPTDRARQLAYPSNGQYSRSPLIAAMRERSKTQVVTISQRQYGLIWISVIREILAGESPISWPMLKIRDSDERAHQHDDAVGGAACIWRESRPADADHPYLTAKRIKLSVGITRRRAADVDALFQEVEGAGDE